MVKLVWYNDLGGLLAHDIDTVIECLSGYYICSKLLFLIYMKMHERKKFASNFIIKQNPFGQAKGATRCVAAVPPIDNNQDYGAPYPCNSLSQHRGAAGDLRLLF